ncbi:MAG: hypothetical protein GC185_06860 [Alphaproteobacteria bacterium]|nr:hypothetical protein [Alphaproteobacteria bacterium]
MGQYHRSEVLREALPRKTGAVLFLESESLFSVDKSRVLFRPCTEIIKYYWITRPWRVPRGVVFTAFFIFMYTGIQKRGISRKAIRIHFKQAPQESDLTLFLKEDV